MTSSWQNVYLGKFWFVMGKLTIMSDIQPQRQSRRQNQAKRARRGRRVAGYSGIGHSRIRLKDALREAVTSIAARPARSILTMTGTVLGCAAFIAIIGLTDTAKGQISEKFNELEATTVTVTDARAEQSLANASSDFTGPTYSYPDDAGIRLRQLNGVVNAGVYFSVNPTAPDQSGEFNQPLTIANRPQADHIDPASGAMLALWGVEGGTLEAAAASLASGVFFDDFHVLQHQSVAVLGQAAAANLGISSVITHPTVFVGNQSYAVIGVLADSGALPELGNAVMIPAPLAIERYNPPTNPAKLLIRTDLGAASLIARQAAYALDHAHPDYFKSAAPPDWSMVTADVNASLNGLLLALAGIALVIGCVAIANTTLVAVMERTGEIGLRQALGAKPVHILSQFLTESVVLGALGGVLGSAVGTAAVILGALARQWTPILDPLLLPAAPAIGIAVGVLAGLYPAWRASRIQPATALQHM
jgi:putative ABC transport system permease protein